MERNECVPDFAHDGVAHRRPRGVAGGGVRPVDDGEAAGQARGLDCRGAVGALERHGVGRRGQRGDMVRATPGNPPSPPHRRAGGSPPWRPPQTPAPWPASEARGPAGTRAGGAVITGCKISLK